MGTWYVPEIFVPSENGFYPLHFMTVILFHRRDFPCCRTNAQNSVRNLCHVPVWHRIRFMCSFAMCRLLLGAFHRIEKQPALVECQMD